jgi:hypothetical protein
MASHRRVRGAAAHVAAGPHVAAAAHRGAATHVSAAAHRSVLGISWRSRYRNAERQGSDGPRNKSRSWAFHRLLTSVQPAFANKPPCFD